MFASQDLPVADPSSSTHQSDIDTIKNMQAFFVGNIYFGSEDTRTLDARTFDQKYRDSFLDSANDWVTFDADREIIPRFLTDHNLDGKIDESDVLASDWKAPLFATNVAYNLKDNQRILNDSNEETRYYPGSSNLLNTKDFCHSTSANSTFDNISTTNYTWTTLNGASSTSFNYVDAMSFIDNGALYDFDMSVTPWELRYEGIPIPISFNESYNINRTINSIDRAEFSDMLGPSFFKDNSLCENFKWLEATEGELSLLLSSGDR